jgi:hypothetical protein
VDGLDGRGKYDSRATPFCCARLAIHWERRDDIDQALLDIGCAIICCRMLP